MAALWHVQQSLLIQTLFSVLLLASPPLVPAFNKFPVGEKKKGEWSPCSKTQGFASNQWFLGLNSSYLCKRVVGKDHLEVCRSQAVGINQILLETARANADISVLSVSHVNSRPLRSCSTQADSRLLSVGVVLLLYSHVVSKRDLTASTACQLRPLTSVVLRLCVNIFVWRCTFPARCIVTNSSFLANLAIFSLFKCFFFCFVFYCIRFYGRLLLFMFCES